LPFSQRRCSGGGIKTLIVSGGETDVCVLATVMATVVFGFRVILPVDALCSARNGTHDTLIKPYSTGPERLSAAPTRKVVQRRRGACR